MKDNLKTGIVQIDSEPVKPEINLEKLERYCKLAKLDEIELIVFPELMNVGYDLEKLIDFNYQYAYCLDFVQKTALKNDLYICCGLMEQEDQKRYNSLFVFDNKGEIIAKYRKMNLFPLSIEEKVFEPGEQIVTFEAGNFKFGLLICYDIRFPELTTAYLNEGCNAYIVISAFPFPRTDHWRILLRSRAIENQSYIIASNRVGKDGSFWFCGNSTIIDPYGNVKASLNEVEENMVSWTIEKSQIISTRQHIPCLTNKNRIKKIL